MAKKNIIADAVSDKVSTTDDKAKEVGEVTLMAKKVEDLKDSVVTALKQQGKKAKEAKELKLHEIAAVIPSADKGGMNEVALEKVKTSTVKQLYTDELEELIADKQFTKAVTDLYPDAEFSTRVIGDKRQIRIDV